jgi:hypothetical protein
MRKSLNVLLLVVLFVICSAQLTWAQKPNVYELGTYPQGTWLATWGINDLGVVVGLGDVPPIDPDSGVGHTHPLAVPLFGPNAGQWMDLGTLGGEQPMGWEEPVIKISNSGLIVSHSTAPDGYAHGVAWTKESGLVDLGTLADTGSPAYADYKSSWAFATNRLGTLIAGGSAPYGGIDITVGFLVPVVWTSSNVWMNGKSVTKWQIHTLDTADFSDLRWDIWGVNDYGQIVGLGFNNSNESIIPIGVLWNPRPGGKVWGGLTLLPPPPSDYPSTCPYDINNRGEIVGIVASADWSTQLPALWKPLDKTRTTYSQPIVLPLPAGFTSCECVGVNDLGDIVGDCWNDTQDLPARWITEDPTFSEIIKFPGSRGFSWGVNNGRIASVTYGDSKKCPADTYGSCGGATQLH